MTRALRAYARLVRLYPSTFRDAYGEDMVALLAAQLRDEPRGRVWARAATDLALTLPTRHLEAHMNLTARSVPPLAVAVAVLAATTAVVGGPIGIAAIVGLVALVFAYTAWRREQPAREPEPHSGRRALVLLGGGAALLALVSFAPQDGPDGLWYVFMAAILGGVVAVTLGVLSGIAHLTHRQST